MFLGGLEGWWVMEIFFIVNLIDWLEDFELLFLEKWGLLKVILEILVLVVLIVFLVIFVLVVVIEVVGWLRLRLIDWWVCWVMGEVGVVWDILLGGIFILVIGKVVWFLEEDFLDKVVVRVLYEEVLEVVRVRWVWVKCLFGVVLEEIGIEIGLVMFEIDFVGEEDWVEG